MPIQVLKPKFHVDECLDAVRECLEKGWTGMGFKTVEFEEAWKNYTGHKYAYYLNSNTAGLHLPSRSSKCAVVGRMAMRLSRAQSLLFPPILPLHTRT